MASRLARLPRWMSHWLGYRPEAVKPRSKYEVALWSFITSFCGLSVVQAIFHYSDYFINRNVPGIIASYVSGKYHRKNLILKIIHIDSHQTGCIRSPRFRRNRKSPRTTACSSLRSLLQRLNWYLRHQIIQSDARPGAVRVPPLAGRFAFNSYCYRRYAVDGNYSPACWRDCFAPGYQ
jgi:hypothetical protein